MNLTRRNILKALGIGAAVSVSGASIAKDPAITSWDEVQAAGKLMDAQEVPLGELKHKGPLHVWNESVEYTVGDNVLASDGKLYTCKVDSNTPFCIDNFEVI